ncbi:uncharacterized protein [Musca autumnalis]|uniref:uncharacterized protein n=1 Tax=Musca autumnalis TaxID=221902 RepID=UPI003CED9754
MSIRCIYWCPNRKQSFGFPKNENERKEWCKILGLDSQSIRPGHRLCQNHFDPASIGSKKLLYYARPIAPPKVENSKVEDTTCIVPDNANESSIVSEAKDAIDLDNFHGAEVEPVISGDPEFLIEPKDSTTNDDILEPQVTVEHNYAVVTEFEDLMEKPVSMNILDNNKNIQNEEADPFLECYEQSNELCQVQLCEDEFHCNECKQSFSSPQDLRAHEKIHQVKPPYICTYDNFKRNFKKRHASNNKKNQAYVVSKNELYCRACLCSFYNRNNSNITGESPKSFNIFEIPNLAEIVAQCSNTSVDQYDEYPQRVCEKCYKKFVYFSEFQKMCKSSLEKYNAIVHDPKLVTCDLENILNESNISLNISSSEDINISNEIEAIDVQQQIFSSKTQKEHGNISLYNQINLFNASTEMGNKEEMLHTEHVVIEEDNLLHSTTRQPNLYNLPNDEVSGEIMPVEAHYRLDDSNECQQFVSSPPDLEDHKKMQQALPLFICTYENCKRKFIRLQSYRLHLKRHASNNKKKYQAYKCDWKNCNRIYKNKSALNMHKRKVHNVGPELNLKTHMCEKCGKVYQSSRTLQNHRITHLDKSEWPFVCDAAECSKKFATKEKLKIHKLRHTGVKKFICPHCGMRKYTKTELRTHINYHTLERTWTCQFCAKVCPSPGHLRMHIRTFHERAKDFACRFCERKFSRDNTRKLHEMKHTGEKPYTCDVCGRRFIQQRVLITHRKIHCLKNEFPSNSKEEE